MTIKNFIDKIVDQNPEQLVEIYDRNHNVLYHGKADFAPLSIYDEYKNSHVEIGVDINGNTYTTVIINDYDDVKESKEETTMNNTITFEFDRQTYEMSANGRFYCTPLNGKKTRIGKLAFETAYNAYMAKKIAEGNAETEEKTEQVEGTKITEETEETEKEINTDAQKPAVITEHGCVECGGCNVEGCVHRDCMRRNPTVIGGLGLCPRLQVEVLKEEKPKTKKASKPRAKKVQVGGMEFDHNGIKVVLTPKQVDFIKHLPDTDFWNNGINSKIWIDVLCDDIGGQFAGKPMTVGAMISTLCEKGLGTRGTERRDGRKCTGFALTELGQKIATELGL